MLLLALAPMLLLAGCEAGRPARAQGVSSGSEDGRLALAVRPLSVRVAIGETATMEFALSNGAGHSVGGCAKGWTTYRLESAGEEYRQFSSPVDGIAKDSMFVIPPGKKLSWLVEIKVTEET